MFCENAQLYGEIPYECPCKYVVGVERLLVGLQLDS